MGAAGNRAVDNGVEGKGSEGSGAEGNAEALRSEFETNQRTNLLA